MKILRHSTVTYRYAPNDCVYKLSAGRGRVRAFVRSSCGNVMFRDSSEGPWLEMDLAEALNAIVTSGYYRHDNRHPIVAQLNTLAGEVL